MHAEVSERTQVTARPRAAPGIAACTRLVPGASDVVRRRFRRALPGAVLDNSEQLGVRLYLDLQCALTTDLSVKRKSRLTIVRVHAQPPCSPRLPDHRHVLDKDAVFGILSDEQFWAPLLRLTRQQVRDVLHVDLMVDSKPWRRRDSGHAPPTRSHSRGAGTTTVISSPQQS